MGVLRSGLPVWGALVWGISRCRTAPVWAQGSAAAVRPSVHSVSHISCSSASRSWSWSDTLLREHHPSDAGEPAEQRRTERNSPLLQRRPVPEELAVLLLLFGRVLVNQLVCFCCVSSWVPLVLCTASSAPADSPSSVSVHLQSELPPLHTHKHTHHTHTHTEKERERERERERHTHTHTHTDRERERERGERDTQTHTHTHTQQAEIHTTHTHTL